MGLKPKEETWFLISFLGLKIRPKWDWNQVQYIAKFLVVLLKSDQNGIETEFLPETLNPENVKIRPKWIETDFIFEERPVGHVKSDQMGLKLAVLAPF